MANRVRLHFGPILKEVRTDLWLSSTSDAEKSVRLNVGFPGSELIPSSSIKMLALQTLEVLSAGTMTKFSWRREDSLRNSGSQKWTRVWCRQSVAVVEFYVSKHRRSTYPIRKQCRFRHPLFGPLSGKLLTRVHDDIKILVP